MGCILYYVIKYETFIIIFLDNIHLNENLETQWTKYPVSKWILDI